VGAGREVFDLATLGIRTRAEGIQRRIETSAGSLANSAGEGQGAEAVARRVLWCTSDGARQPVP
jgi:hypothetical protein